jgi:hypothetical protein
MPACHPITVRHCPLPPSRHSKQVRLNRRTHPCTAAAAGAPRPCNPSYRNSCIILTTNHQLNVFNTVSSYTRHISHCHRERLQPPLMVYTSVLLTAREGKSPGKSHGNCIQRLSASSYASVDAVFPPATSMHLATAAHVKPLRTWCMGGSGNQCASSPTISDSHDEVSPLLLLPPRMAKRPSLITHPQQ